MATPLRKAIRLALRSRLLGLTNWPPILWEGQPYAPPVGVLHLREKLLVAPQGMRPAGLGSDAPVRAQVLYQIDVVAPLMTSNAAGTTATSGATTTATADEWADQVCARYAPAGMVLTHDGRRVVVENVSSASAVPMPPSWQFVPVTIAAVCDASAFLS